MPEFSATDLTDAEFDHIIRSFSLAGLCGCIPSWNTAACEINEKLFPDRGSLLLQVESDFRFWPLDTGDQIGGLFSGVLHREIVGATRCTIT